MFIWTFSLTMTNTIKVHPTTQNITILVKNVRLLCATLHGKCYVKTRKLLTVSNHTFLVKKCARRLELFISDTSTINWPLIKLCWTREVLKICISWDVMLCQWASSCWHSEGHGALNPSGNNHPTIRHILEDLNLQKHLWEPYVSQEKFCHIMMQLHYKGTCLK